MNTQNQFSDTRMRGILSSLWIFYFVNMFARDLHEFANPAFIKQLIAGITVSETILLVAAMVLEIPIVMIVLSRVLTNKINWFVNIVVAVLMLGVTISNNLNPDQDDVFFMIAETLGLLTVITLSVRWRLRLVKEKKEYRE